jgi:plasmid stabilization system protein ParE
MARDGHEAASHEPAGAVCQRIRTRLFADPCGSGGELNLPCLRHWSLKEYPHLVFYVERDDHIDVWRILHGQRDIPAWMQQSEG